MFTYAVTSTSSVCSIANSTLTALTAGVCKLTATKALSTNFEAKTSSEFSYTIAKAGQTITFAALSGKTYGDSSFSISASSSSGLTILFAGTSGVCSVGASTLSGGTTTANVSIVSAGSCTITSSQAGNINYNSATAEVGSALSRSFTIAQKNLTITGATASNKVYDGSDAATGNLSTASLVGVSFSDDVSIKQTGFTATFSDANAADGKTVTFASVTLEGTKAANYSVNQPTAVANIAKASAGLAWATPSAITYGATLSSTQLNASASVAGSYAYTPTSGTLLNAGSRTLSVTFTPTSSNYAVETRTVNLQVNQKPVTVTASNRGFVYGGSFTPGFTYSALVGSDTPSAVTYTYAGTGGTAYSSSTTAPTTRGAYSISPSAVVLSVGDTANYDFTYVDGSLSITQATQSALVVTAASQSLTYSPNPSPATTALSMLAGSTGSGTGLVTYAVASGNTVCSVLGSTLTALTAGTCTVTVTRAADLNFEAKTSDPITITISKAAQTLSFAAISDKVYGDAQFSVTPTATSGLTVVITSSDTSVCDVPSALTIRILNVGTCTIVAQQSGSINYEAATAASGSSLTRSFSVSQKVLTVSGVSTVSRVYDASLSATPQLQFSGASVNGIVGSDSVTLDSTAATGTYTSKNVGVNKPITIAGLALAGTHAARYTVQAPSGVVGTVTQATINTSGITVVSRNYDGTRNATLNTIGHSLSGVLGSDVVSLDASGYSATYDTATAAVSKAVTVSGLALSGTDAANYSVQQPALVGAISKATATVSFTSALTVVYDGSSRSVTTATSPGALTVNVTYAGRGSTSYASSVTGPTNAGTYTVGATVVETNYLGTNSSNFDIEKQTVTVTLDSAALTTTFNGRARIVGATTSPSGKALVVTYAGTGSTTYASSTFAPTNAGAYSVTATVNEQNFQGIASQTLTVAKASQDSLSIVNGSSATYGESIALMAMGGSGNGVMSYARVSGPCTVDASTGAMIAGGIGTCVVQVAREASANYVAATSATRSIVVGRARQSVSFTSAMPSNPAVGDTYTPTASATSRLVVSVLITAGEGTVCTRNASTVSFIASGSCEVTASQAGSATYEAATSIRQTIVVGKLSQAITFSQPARKRLGDPAFMLTASASSGLTVTYSLTSGGSVCSVTSSGLVTIAALGTCSVAVSQAGDAVYSAAATITRDIEVIADVPSAPKITSVSGGDAMVTVGYAEPSSNGGSAIVGYRLSARPASGATVTSSQCDLVARTCVVNGLVNGTEYTVSLSAVNAAGVSEADVAPGTTSPAPVLEAVRNVAGQRADASMTVTWEDPQSFGDGSFDRYELSIRPEDGTFGTPVTVQSVDEEVMAMSLDEQVHQLTSQSRVYTFNGLLNTKTYFVKIVTITTSRLAAAASNTAAATVLPLEAPSAPQDVTVESTNGRTATISWKAPLSDGGSPLTSYVVTPSSGTCSLATALSTMCSVSGLAPGQSFSVTVRAVNAIGQSASSTESVVMPDVPGTPSISTVTLSGTSASVTFAAPTQNGGRLITSYSVTAVNSKDTADIARCTTTSLSCVINGLKVGTTYNIAVRARNSVGESASSAMYSLSLAAPAQAAPAPTISRGSAAPTTVWETYRSENSRATRGLVGLPPAPGTVKVAAAGSRTRVIASGTKATGGPITQALITVASKTGRTLARINVRVSSENPSATVTVPFKSAAIKVFVQFANDYGVSTGGPIGINVKEGNTYDSTVVAGKPQLMGSISGLPVYFNSGSAALTSAGMAELRTIATEVKQTTGLVYVTGYARLDEVRGWKVDVLSRARAEAVAKYLAKLGVRQWIRFQGAGALKSDWGDWRDRRVIVHAGGPVGVA
ncbi:MAG: YDG domain-containing protein [Actinomycetota bacterium]